MKKDFGKLLIAASASVALGASFFAATAQAAFKEFSLNGQSVTTYNERGYTLGIDMEKRQGEKIFIANLVLPEGRKFHNNQISSTYSFDSLEVTSLNDTSRNKALGKTDYAVSWEIDRFPADTLTVPRDSDLFEFMRRYHLKFNYVDSDGRARSTQIGLRNSSSTISDLIKR